MAKIIAWLQNTASVERIFSNILNNKTKLRNYLGVNTVESIARAREKFEQNFEMDQN